MPADTQSRKWQITANNPLDKGLDHNEIKHRLAQLKSCTYWCMADEIGLETHTPHTHIYVQLRTPSRFSRIKKLFPDAHIEQARGSAAENKAYTAKSGKWAEDPKADTSIPGTLEEWGELPDEPGQGFRSDIAELYNMIAEGMNNAEIMAQNPNLAVHISRMDKMRQDILEERFRNTFRKLSVTYIFGPTETGKTRHIMETHGYCNVFRITNYKFPFDRYNSEPVICFEEFRSSLLIADMLNFLDGYPISLPARYADRIACYETVYIVSNINLRKQYANVQYSEEDTWRAFLRRIQHVIEYRQDGSSLDHGSGIDYVFPPAPDWIKDAESADDCDKLPL